MIIFKNFQKDSVILQKKFKGFQEFFVKFQLIFRIQAHEQNFYGLFPKYSHCFLTFGNFAEFPGFCLLRPA